MVPLRFARLIPEAQGGSKHTPFLLVGRSSALLDRSWGKPMQGHAVLAVSAPKSVREMSDGELMAMIEKRTAGGGGIG